MTYVLSVHNKTSKNTKKGFSFNLSSPGLPIALGDGRITPYNFDIDGSGNRVFQMNHPYDNLELECTFRDQNGLVYPNVTLPLVRRSFRVEIVGDVYYDLKYLPPSEEQEATTMKIADSTPQPNPWVPILQPVKPEPQSYLSEGYIDFGNGSKKSAQCTKENHDKEVEATQRKAGLNDLERSYSRL